MSVKPLAVLGGTFDPVHFGHLRVAWEVAEQLDCELHLMPSAQPPHRATPGADAEDRAAMLELALAGQDRLRLDRRELARRGPSYSVDTLAEIRQEIGSERPLLWVLGADAFRGLHGWRRWRDLPGLAHIVAMTRPRQRLDKLDPALHDAFVGRWTGKIERLHREPAGRVLALRVTPLAVSSSQVRAALVQGRSPRFLLPQAVLAYILERGLYQAG